MLLHEQAADAALLKGVTRSMRRGAPAGAAAETATQPTCFKGFPLTAYRQSA